MTQIIYPMTRALKRLADGSVEPVMYETSIDIGALHKLALKANGNKSRRSSIGPLTVRIIQTEQGKVSR